MTALIDSDVPTRELDKHARRVEMSLPENVQMDVIAQAICNARYHLHTNPEDDRAPTVRLILGSHVHNNNGNDCYLHREDYACLAESARAAQADEAYPHEAWEENGGWCKCTDCGHGWRIPTAEPVAQEKCFCDRMYPDSKPDASCGDCPTRDYKSAEPVAQGEAAEPLLDALDHRHLCHVTGKPEWPQNCDCPKHAAELEAAQPRAVPDGRLNRQRVVHDWCVAAFGDDHAKSIEQRGIRLVEEAIEAGQACGCQPDMVHRLVDHIFGKPMGDLSQELGGVGVTMLALAQAARLDADASETKEIERILSKPLAHFAARNAAKNAAGFNVLAAAPSPGESTTGAIGENGNG